MSEAEDVLQELLSAKWKGVEFPVTKMRMSIAHDLVEHKVWGVDGARVESTGLAPLRFSFSAPLLRGISPGRSERWSDLYPTKFRALLATFQLKAKGELQHPEFGGILCKAERLDADWEASRRGGVDVEMSFVQTTIANDSSFLTSKSQVHTAAGAAESLDSSGLKADLRLLLLSRGLPLPPYLEKPSISLGEMANKIKAVLDAPSLLAHRAAGQIDALGYQLDRIGRSASGAGTPLTWPVTQAVERGKAALFELQQNLLAGIKNVAFFTVPMDTTLAGAARQIPGASVTDLMKLNPELMSRPEILKGTIVRYYATRAAA